MRTIILCILCIHVKKSFCARGRDQTPELEGHHFVSLVDFFFPFLFSSWPFVVLRVSSWIALFFCCFRQVPPPPCRTDHWRKKPTIVVEDEPRINTKIVGPALLRRRQGMKPPGNAGVPPAQVLAQPRPSPPPGSTGNGARTLLGPGPCRSRRQGGRVPHRRETERYATGVHAGGTPAFPGGASSHRSCFSRGMRRLAGPQPVPMRQSRHAWWPFVDSSFFLLFQTSTLA